MFRLSLKAKNFQRSSGIDYRCQAFPSAQYQKDMSDRGSLRLYSVFSIF